MNSTADNSDIFFFNSVQQDVEEFFGVINEKYGKIRTEPDDNTNYGRD